MIRTGKTVVGEDGRRADEDAVTDAKAAVEQRGVLHLAAVAEHHAEIHGGARPDDAIGSDPRPPAKVRERPDLRAGADLHVLLHQRERMDEGRLWLGHLHELYHTHREIPDHDSTGRLKCAGAR